MILTVGRKLRAYLSNSKGNTGLMMGLSAIPLLIITGGIVDYGRALSVKAKAQMAADTGTLAAAEALRKNTDITKPELKRIVKKYIDANINNISYNSFTIKKTSDNTLIVNFNAMPKTSFLPLINIKKFNIHVRSAASFDFPPLEVVLVLDNTGSMDFYGNGTHRCNGAYWCKNNTRMAKLKAAAKTFVDKLADKVYGNASNLKVGVVPYSEYVRLDTSKKNASWLDKSHLRRRCVEWRYWWCVRYERSWNGFVGFRKYAWHSSRFDEGYDSHKIPALNGDGSGYFPGGLTSVLPLTPLDDAGKRKVKAKIDAMRPDGGTYISGGLVWGGRLLSHKNPYHEGMAYDDVITKKAKKVIVLMTDGVNTCSARNNSRGYVRCNSGNNIDNRGFNSLRRTCSKLKEINPNTNKPYADIITVGFELDDLNGWLRNRVRTELQNCASMGHYDATKDDISTIFGKIGNKLAKLHLSQ